MTRVLLVYPQSLYRRLGHSWIPLGLPFIAAALQKRGHQVSIFDRFAVQYRVGTDREKVNKAMVEHIRQYRPDIIGLNTISPLIYDTAESCRIIKELFPGIILLAGGHHATALPELTLKKIPELDGLVAGEGEYALVRIVDGDDAGKIPGVWWKDKTMQCAGLPSQQIEKLDDLPFPALELMDLPFYLRPRTQGIKGFYLSTVSILTSRGCPYRCDFCAESLTYGRGTRFHSPDYVLEWLNRILSLYSVNGVYFHDNDFLADEKRAEEICRRIVNSGLYKKIRFAIQARAGRINPQILKALKKAGCVSIEIGIEAVTEEKLTAFHKGSSVEMNERAIALCRKFALPVHAYTITGYENETMEDLHKWLDWIKKTGPDSFSLGLLQIYPGTRLYQEKGQNYFEKNDWTEETIKIFYQKDHLSDISSKDRAQWEKKYLIPFRRRQNRFNLVRNNNMPQLTGIVYHKIISVIKEKKLGGKDRRQS